MPKRGAPPAAPGDGGGGGGGAPPPPKRARAPTAFEARLYALVSRVPRGRVTTYGALAQALKGSCARAVGGGLRRNPFAPAVPCHRVVASSLELGGFSGQWGEGCPNVARKRRMLESEGVAFDARGRVARAHLFTAADLEAALKGSKI